MNKPQLFLLHFAGGNARSYNFLLPYLKDFDVFPLELPGRGKRISELLLNNYQDVINDYYNQIISRISGPFLIYGHSMGAIISLYLTEKLESKNLPPKAIILSGNAGPGTFTNEKRYLLPKNEFISELQNLGGFPDEILTNEELFDFFEPMLRSDFEVLEKDDMAVCNPLQTPIFALMGNNEINVNEIDNWKRFTKNNFFSKTFPGGHFFIFEYAEDIAKIISDCYFNEKTFKGQH